MALSETQLREYVQRLLLSRMRILCNHGFYGLLLMHMRYGVDETVETAYTDGERIVFGSGFLDDLSDSELDFVMMHEIMHVVLHHCFRGAGCDDELFNKACDIVVNSNLLLENKMHLSSITLAEYGESMHLTPDGKEGYEFTAEQVYGMLTLLNAKDKSGNTENKSGEAQPEDRWDDHGKWGSCENPDYMRDAWNKRLKDAAEAMEIRDPLNARGTLPLFAQRLLGKLKEAKTDWRAVLNDFVQEEVVDYSFMPPDRRFSDGDFFLPDFNEKDVSAENILFMIDTSGSMSDSMITEAYSEVKGALEQFGGKLKGWLGFFDAAVVEPVPFETVNEFEVIHPEGGGGTDFGVVFDYVREKMETPPVSIIVLTDGYAPFPEQENAGGIPVLWLLNNKTVNPPWGKVARI